MSRTIHAFDLLDLESIDVTAFCVVFGDELFLKTLVMRRLRTVVLGDDEQGIPFTTYQGDLVQWLDVSDELATASLFGPDRRLVVIEEADGFVSKYRAELEEYVVAPSSTGVLILTVDTWVSNTRLFKALDKHQLQVECRAPTSGRGKTIDRRRVRSWLEDRSREHHGQALSKPAADLLLELVGTEFGLLDQELAKLALYVESGQAITPELVRDVVGGVSLNTTWELVDAAADGDAEKAIRLLDQLLQTGENSLGLFGQISWSLRRFNRATSIYERAEQERRRMSLRDALEQAGFRKWPREMLANAERQLKQLGRHRAGRLFRQLLKRDLALKGSHSQDQRARLVLELLLISLSSELRDSPVSTNL